MDCEALQRSWEGYVDHGQLIMRGFVAIFESDAGARGSRFFRAATMLTVEHAWRHESGIFRIRCCLLWRHPLAGITNLHRIKPFAQDISSALILLRKMLLSL
jgi:hypothetical protein